MKKYIDCKCTIAENKQMKMSMDFCNETKPGEMNLNLIAIRTPTTATTTQNSTNKIN